MATIKITCNLDETVVAKLDALCAKSGYCRSEQIEGLIDAEYGETMQAAVLGDPSQAEPTLPSNEIPER